MKASFSKNNSKIKKTDEWKCLDGKRLWKKKTRKTTFFLLFHFFDSLNFFLVSSLIRQFPKSADENYSKYVPSFSFYFSFAFALSLSLYLPIDLPISVFLCKYDTAIIFSCFFFPSTPTSKTEVINFRDWTNIPIKSNL